MLVKKMTLFKKVIFVVLLSGVMSQAHAVLGLDRTRIIFNEEDGGVSVVIENQDSASSFLAQTWIEKPNGEKLNNSLVALPFLQKLSPKQKKQIKITYMEGQNLLPQDRESLFYFNLLGIPPQGKESSVVQFTIQSRLKLFYRPKGIDYKMSADNDFRRDLSVIKQGGNVKLTNPTPYNIIITNLNINRSKDNDFPETVVAPFSDLTVKLKDPSWSSFEIAYIDDFGGLKFSKYQCGASPLCQLLPQAKNK
ncbi:molecular chaperone [Morganella psychrotolerans]|uniref:fimbrial biogenesis chaperone n=1 Tax=Morganella psychrotolerans TaxID=368603 RepID=UPI0039B067DB